MYCDGRYFCMTGERAAGCNEIHSVSLANLYQRMVEDKLDPKAAEDINGKLIDGRDTSASGEDYKIIASLARKLRTEDVAVIESEIARRYPKRYQDQNEKHGDRKGKTYWRYSIVRYFERRRSHTASERASRLRRPLARFASLSKEPTPNVGPSARTLKGKQARKIIFIR
jgi:hypothetical protein